MMPSQTNRCTAEIAANAEPKAGDSDINSREHGEETLTLQKLMQALEASTASNRCSDALPALQSVRVNQSGDVDSDDRAIIALTASTLLQDALEKGDLEGIRFVVLDAGFGVDACEELLGRNTSLIQRVCVFGHLEIIKFLLAHGACINDVDPVSNDTLLHVACEHGHFELVQWLVENGAMVESTNGRKETPLMVAASHLMLRIVQYLVSVGADATRLSALKGKVTYQCAAKGRLRMLEYFLDRGIGKYNRNGGHVNLLQGAVHGGHQLVTRFLLQRGHFDPAHVVACVCTAVRSRDMDLTRLLLEYVADVNAADTVGNTPLYYAIELGDLEIAEVLVLHGADLAKPTSSYRYSALHLMAKHGRLAMLEMVQRIHGTDATSSHANASSGRTALQVATLYGHCNVVRFLLDVYPLDFDIDFGRRHQEPILTLAAQEGQLEIVELLVSKGANVNKTVEGGSTALIQAAGSGHFDIVKCLCENGASIELTRECDGATALAAAAQDGHVHIVEYLVEEHHANIFAATSYGLTVLGEAAINGHAGTVRVLLSHDHHADDLQLELSNVLCQSVLYGRLEIVKLLVTKGADIDTVYGVSDGDTLDRITLTPLAIAAMTGNVEIVQYLCENGADVEGVTDGNETALFLAAEKGYLDVVEYLVNERNANLECANCAPFNFTPVEVATCHGNDDVVQFLLGSGARPLQRRIVDYDAYWDLSDEDRDRSRLPENQQLDLVYWDRKEALDLVLGGYFLTR